MQTEHRDVGIVAWEFKFSWRMIFAKKSCVASRLLFNTSWSGTRCRNHGYNRISGPSWQKIMKNALCPVNRSKTDYQLFSYRSISFSFSGGLELRLKQIPTTFYDSSISDSPRTIESILGRWNYWSWGIYLGILLRMTQKSISTVARLRFRIPDLVDCLFISFWG